PRPRRRRGRRRRGWRGAGRSWVGSSWSGSPAGGTAPGVSAAQERPEDQPQGVEDDAQVHAPAGPLDVLDVVADPLLEVGSGGAGASDLPEPGHAGADGEAGLAPGGVELVL